MLYFTMNLIFFLAILLFIIKLHGTYGVITVSQTLISYVRDSYFNALMWRLSKKGQNHPMSSSTLESLLLCSNLTFKNVLERRKYTNYFLQYDF